MTRNKPLEPYAPYPQCGKPVRRSRVLSSSRRHRTERFAVAPHGSCGSSLIRAAAPVGFASPGCGSPEDSFQRALTSGSRCAVGCLGCFRAAIGWPDADLMGGVDHQGAASEQAHRLGHRFHLPVAENLQCRRVTRMHGYREPGAVAACFRKRVAADVSTTAADGSFSRSAAARSAGSPPCSSTPRAADRLPAYSRIEPQRAGASGGRPRGRFVAVAGSRLQDRGELISARSKWRSCGMLIGSLLAVALSP